MAEPLERTSIGKYQVVRLLGEGAMGQVYHAHDPGLDRAVAVKIIHKDLLDKRQSSSMIARFRNEAMAAGRLQHPGIVAVYELGEEDSTSFIVMEYAPGEDLEQYVLRRAPLKLREVAGLMMQLLDALQYAHGRGVVHRDIKPANLIVTAGERLKITDFGVARIESIKLTRTGTMLGTPMYMAPEQYMGTGVDHHADLFASAVLFYELITGHKPFEGETIQEVAYKVCHVEPPPPSQVNPHLPPALDPVVLRALSKAKDARYASANDFGRAIVGALTGTRSPTASRGLPAVAPPPPLPVPPPAPVPVPVPVAAQPSGPRSLSGATIGPAVTGASVPPVPWPASVVKALEAVLLPVIGPLATAHVRRSASRAHDRAELLELLRRGAGSEAENPVLLGNLRAALDGTAASPSATSVPAPVAGPGATTSGTGPGASVLGPEELERATQALVGFVGPIARVLVKKAAAQARSFEDLCARLGEHLTSDADRAEFRRKASVR